LNAYTICIIYKYIELIFLRPESLKSFMSFDTIQAVDISISQNVSSDVSVLQDLYVSVKKYSKGGITATTMDVFQKNLACNNLDLHLALTGYRNNIMKNSSSLFETYSSFSYKQITNPKEVFLKSVRILSIQPQKVLSILPVTPQNGVG